MTLASFEWIGQSFLIAMCADLCRPDITQDEVTKRIRAIQLTLVEHWDTFELLKRADA